MDELTSWDLILVLAGGVGGVLTTYAVALWCGAFVCWVKRNAQGEKHEQA